MKRILICIAFVLHSCLANAQIVSDGQYLTIRINNYVLGKNLNKVDKRFKNDETYPLSKYVVIEIENASNDTFSFFEHRNILAVDRVSYFDSVGNVTEGINCYFEIEPSTILLPKSHKAFIHQFINFPDTEYCVFTINFIKSDKGNNMNPLTQEVKFSFKKLIPYGSESEGNN